MTHPPTAAHLQPWRASNMGGSGSHRSAPLSRTNASQNLPWSTSLSSHNLLPPKTAKRP
eukprot:CAMPEP_0197582012 /NCGR_PEP_ID=MMETSP1326-20131121/5356_1 /TAXON_ID=1155430 /ORGANISM="Genus nov. species nov., Strain RCC2288" /LENGTH=58 /DNA_ID=CAMNT_0043146019 /DNA_START=83 /DNA_END=259 /DNA_ORIENTATION=-